MMNENNKSFGLFKTIALIIIIIYLSWYILPIFRYYFNGTNANIIMFILLLIWIIIMIFSFKKQEIVVHKWFLGIIVLLLFYFIDLFLRDSNISEFIKLGIMFWFPAVVYYLYYLNNDSKSIVTLYYFSIVCIIITLIPTLIELINNISSIREMAYYASLNLEEQLIKSSYNVGNFAFIYGLVFVSLMFYNRVKYRSKYRIVFILLTILSIICVLRASFTIALILLLIEMIIYKSKLSKNVIKNIIIALIIFIVLINLSTILYSLSNVISNDKIKERIIEFSTFLNSGNMSGDLQERVKLYNLSFSTFLSHPLFGIGGYYYVPSIPIGYHSQFIDDIARYGILFGINLILLFVNYFAFIKEKLCFDKYSIALVDSIKYTLLILLVVNPLFECQWLSFTIFLMLPCYLSMRHYKTSNFKKNIDLNENNV